MTYTCVCISYEDYEGHDKKMVKTPSIKRRPWRSIIYTPLFVNKERYIMCMRIYVMVFSIRIDSLV